MSEENLQLSLDCPTETWRPAPYTEYAEYYAVSDHGRVMRVKTQSGKSCQKILSSDNIGGYKQVMLCAKGVTKPIKVHIMVALAFLGECPDGCEINHIDTDKSNSRVSNLEYVTHKQNMEHAAEHGLYAHGETHPEAKLTNSQIIEIRTGYQHDKHSIRRLALQYGVNTETIRAILKGRSWSHIPNANEDEQLNASLAKDKVEAIRTMYAAGCKQAAIARVYGVSISYVSLIVNGKRRTGVRKPTLATTESGAL